MSHRAQGSFISSLGLGADAVEEPFARALVRARLFRNEQPRLGRYEIERRLGAGGMGVVYAARDLELDRGVAIKLLFVRGGASWQQRLRAEARALARLSHANVAQVFDCGSHDDRFYIVMELIEGPTLRQWQLDRPWPEIVDAYRQAGLGLAAAHDAGLVHRDFKPDNVLVGADGRPRVVDFGLVRSEAATTMLGDSDGAETELGARSRSPMGTPSYMSPEQRRGAEADARSDLYSFCVALFEALAGEQLPFDDPRDPVPAWERLPSHLPRRLVRALGRGLAVDPERRFGSMRDLLRAIERPAFARSRRFAVTGATLGLLGAWSVGRTDARPPVLDPCDRLIAKARPFDATARSDVRRRFELVQPSYGGATWAAVEARITAHVAEWTTVTRQACADPTVAPAAAVLRCLEGVMIDRELLLQQFARADALAVEASVERVWELPVPYPCLSKRDEEGAASQSRARTLGQIDRALAEIAAELERDDRRASEERLLEIAEMVRRDGDAVAVARYWRLRATAMPIEQPVERAELQERAYFHAMEAGLLTEAAQLAGELAFNYAYLQQDGDEAEVWLRHAEAASRRFDVVPRVVATLARARAYLADRRHHRDEAIAGLSAAIDQLPSAHPDRVTLMLDLGYMLNSAQQPQRARELLEAAIELEEELYGAGHPTIGRPLIALAMSYDMVGDARRAEALLRRVIEIWTNAYGPDHPPLLAVYNNLAIALLDLGDLEAAVRSVEEALRLAALGDQPFNEQIAEHTAGNAAQRQGRYDDAVRHYGRERELIEASLGADHPDVAHPIHSLARVHLLRGDTAEARKLANDALARWQQAFGDDDALVAFPHHTLGQIELVEGHPDRALRSYERALAIRSQLPDPSAIAKSEFGVAQATWALGQHDAALAIAERALARLDAESEDHRSIATWLREPRTRARPVL